MSKVQSPEPKVVAADHADAEQDRHWTLDVGRWTVTRTHSRRICRLVLVRAICFSLGARMNQGDWKRFWTWCQRVFGAGWIHFATYNLMQVYGLEHVEAASRERPILLVANHRSFFDMYMVSTVLFRNTTWRKQLFFPVRGRFFYQSPLGLFVNLVMGWWSMYPPFFASGEKPISEKRAFDKFSFRLLTELCRNGPGNVIGFHPEGTRNKGADPYSYLPAQPGSWKTDQGRRSASDSGFHCGPGKRSAKTGDGKLDGAAKRFGSTSAHDSI